MTTEIVVKANHGWPVKVTGVKPGTLEPTGHEFTVPAGEHRSAHAHSTQDLLVHEIQPNEGAVSEPFTTDTLTATGDTE